MAKLQAVINSLAAKLNNSGQLPDFLPPMSHFWEQTHDSTFPDFPDVYAQYSDATGAINNPLGGYENQVNNVMPRGAFPMIVTEDSSSPSTFFTLQTIIFEPVWSPIFSKTFDSSLGLSNIQTLNVVINFNNNLGRILSYAPPTGVTIQSATITSFSFLNGSAPAQFANMGIQAPTLFFKYSTPTPDYVPRPLEYRADRIDYWSTVSNTAAPSATATSITAQNIQLGSIPDSLLIFVRESNQQIAAGGSPNGILPSNPVGQPLGGGCTVTDTAANITGVNLTFDNLTGQGSTANEQQLYSISRENMLQDTFEQYHGWSQKASNTPTGLVGTIGSFLMLKFGKDITLQQGKYPGMIGQFNLQINVNYKPVLNLVQPTLFIVAFTPEKLILGPNSCEKVLGVPHSLASGEGGSVGYVPWDEARKDFGAGRMFHPHHGGRMMKYVRPIHEFIKQHKLASKGLKLIPHPLAQALSMEAEKYGYGEGGRVRHSRKGHGEIEEGCEGGAILSKEDLVSRIRQL